MIRLLHVTPSSSDQRISTFGCSHTVPSRTRDLHSSYTAKIRGVPATILTVFLGTVAMRKSSAWRNAPNASALSTLSTVLIGPKQLAPPQAAAPTRDLTTNVCAVPSI